MGENGWKKDDVSLHVDGWNWLELDGRNWLIYSWKLLKKVNFKTLKSKLDDVSTAGGAKGIQSARVGSQ